MKIVEGVVALVKQVGVYLCNRFHSACNVYADGVVAIHRAKQIEKATPGGVVVIHFNFLTDYALLLLHRLLGEIGMADEVEENVKVFVKSVGAGKEVAGAVKGGVGICRCTRFCKALKGVKLLAFEKLVLKKMCNTVGKNGFLSVTGKSLSEGV